MNKRLYVAYGSNLNIRQMRGRCPSAKLVGSGVIEDYELQFKGRPNGAFATIAPKEGSKVPVAVWEIRPMDEKRLDYYEGYPTHYFKQDVPVKLENESVTAMVYIMDLKMEFGMPSSFYYQVVHEGYMDCGLDTEFLTNAMIDSAKNYYHATSMQNSQNMEEEEADMNEMDDGVEDEIGESESAGENITMW